MTVQSTLKHSLQLEAKKFQSNEKCTDTSKGKIFQTINSTLGEILIKMPKAMKTNQFILLSFLLTIAAFGCTNRSTSDQEIAGAAADNAALMNETEKENLAVALRFVIPHGVRICAKRYKKRVSKVRFESTKT